MASTILPYDLALKKAKFDDFIFSAISAHGIGGLVYDKQSKPKPDEAAFRSMLLEAMSANSGSKVVKILLFFTPKQPEFDKLGFLYLAEKTIQAFKLDDSKAVQDWENYICNRSFFDEVGSKDWMLIYANKEIRGQGLSHINSQKECFFRDYEIYTETGKFLHREAPKQFNLKAIEAEKKNYLKKYINTAGSPPNLQESSSLVNSLLELPGVVAKSPLDDRENHYTVFRELSGYELPEELKLVYSLFNGLTYGENSYNFLGIDELINAWKEWKAVYDEWLLEELKSCESDRNKTLPMYTTPYWIPFMADGNGNNLALDFAPGKGGKAGQIIAFGADEQKIAVRAADFNSFLALLATNHPSVSFYWTGNPK